MHNKIRRLGSWTLGLGVMALAAAIPAGAAEVYREYAPRADIDPARGVLGDITLSNTYQYWKDGQAVEAHRAWASGEHADAWKLNWKHMDFGAGDLHGGHVAVDEGEALVKRLAAREPEFLTCLGEGKGDLTGLAAGYPKYAPDRKRIVTLEAHVEHCAATALWQDIRQGSPANTKIAAYLKSLSAGQPVNVDIGSAPLMDAYRRGEQLFYARVGQLNFACASCHTPGSIMGHRLRGEVPTTPFGDTAHYPTYRTPVGEIESLHQRFARCLIQMRVLPLKPGDPAYVDLEVFYTVLSNGYPIAVPSVR
jgi:sulfur-oxidizing protein SoxA